MTSDFGTSTKPNENKIRIGCEGIKVLSFYVEIHTTHTLFGSNMKMDKKKRIQMLMFFVLLCLLPRLLNEYIIKKSSIQN